MARRNWTDITVTDQFCGAGGSSPGAAAAGLRIRMAMNHWRLAIETHNTNFPNTDHDCADVSAADPRRYPSTDILITSPECTTHSPAGGSRRSTPQRDLFLPNADDAATVRSRATMWDVPRFAEYHRYRYIITENVWEVTRWELFEVWRQAMTTLGYEHRIVSLNSMFALPTPQSRDRIYIVLWRKDCPAPDLDITPAAKCQRCGPVEAVQTWKNGRVHGKYRRQYVYSCPTCRAEVLPYYFCALNAIDFSLPAQRIGDRKRPLKPRTMERIRFGLEKYGRRALVVRTNMTSGVECRVRDASSEPHMSQPTSLIDGVLSPWTILSSNSDGEAKGRVRSVSDPHFTQTCHGAEALVAPGFLASLANSGGQPSPYVVSAANDGARPQTRVRGLDEVVQTVHAGGGNAALVCPTAPFLAILRANGRPGTLADPLATFSTGRNHALVSPGALLSQRDSEAMHIGPLTEPTMAQTTVPGQHALVSPAPFMVSNYRVGVASPMNAPTPTMPTLEVHSVAIPELRDVALSVEECFFRMLQPPEVGQAMAFPRSYTVLGDKGQQVKQYGNAVTPPAMQMLIVRCVQAMTGERRARRSTRRVR